MSEKMREDFIAWVESLNVGYDTRFTDFIGGDGEFFDGEVQGLFACWQASRESAYTAIDMTTAAADGFRDGAASKSEPCDGCFMAEAEALRKDAERLNWLDGRSCAVVENQCYSQPEGELAGYDWSIFGQCGTVREAIDYAMSKEPKD